MQDAKYVHNYLFDVMSKILLTMKRITSKNYEEFEGFHLQDIGPLLNLYNEAFPNNPYHIKFTIRGNTYNVNIFKHLVPISLSEQALANFEKEFRKMLLFQSEESKKPFTNGDNDLVYDVYTLERLDRVGSSTAGFHYYDLLGNKYTLSFTDLRIMNRSGNYITNTMKLEDRHMDY